MDLNYAADVCSIYEVSRDNRGAIDEITLDFSGDVDEKKYY